jgi:hypothetical protein
MSKRRTNMTVAIEDPRETYQTYPPLGEKDLL